MATASFDAAFSDLGLDPATLSPSQRVDPQTGQPAIRHFPVPYPRTGQGGEPRLTLSPMPSPASQTIRATRTASRRRSRRPVVPHLATRAPDPGRRADPLRRSPRTGQPMMTSRNARIGLTLALIALLLTGIVVVGPTGGRCRSDEDHRLFRQQQRHVRR